MSNHLIIGLGGTGGKIIRAFRKAVFQEYREKMDNPSGVSLGYLYVDSDDAMMGLENSSWKILGHSVQLPKSSQVVIKGANLKERLNNINNYPGIKPWVGSRTLWNDVLGGIVGEALGGQKRRLGRFLFACSVDKFMSALHDQVRMIKSRSQSGENNITFHVLCGLAGGTGSGSLIDVVTQIRKEYPRINNDVQNRIIIYALLPDRQPKSGWDTGNYHANGYAALLELNALSTKQYMPYDVSATLTERDASGAISAARFESDDDIFNGCYVFSNENENGLTADVAEELPHILANFLYYKIIVVKGVPWDELGRAENAENGDGLPEVDRTGTVPVRSKRFLSFGIKRLAIPEKEIREYLVYSYARQAVLQLRYNNWEDTRGYVNLAQTRDFKEFVHQKETLNGWLISDEHLTLSTGILPQDRNNKNWNGLTVEWQNILPKFKKFIKENVAKDKWLDELSIMCEQRFEDDFRGIGVPRFYALKADARKEMAKEVRGVIEATLFEEWNNGQKSMEDLSRLLDELIVALEERYRNIDAQVEKLKGFQKTQEGYIQENRTTWAQIGPLAAAFRKREKVLDHQAECLQKFYTYRTLLEAWAFTGRFLPVLVDELRLLASNVEGCTRVINQAHETFTASIDARMKDGEAEEQALRKELVRFYNPDHVKKVGKRWVGDQKEQQKLTSTARRALIDELGDTPTFALFKERISYSRLIDSLEKVCEQKVEAQHSELAEKEKVLGMSMIGKLRDRYDGHRDDLRQYITRLVEHAGNYVFFDNSEINRAAPGIPKSSMASRLSIISTLAQRPAKGSFDQELKTIFENSAIGDKDFVHSEVNPYEVALIKISNLFPLRYVSQVRWLKDKYDVRVNGNNAERARLEVHTEGDGSQFSSLYAPTQRELEAQEEQKRIRATPYLLLGKAMDLIKPYVNQETGEEQLRLIRYDEDDLPAHISIGRQFSASRDTLSLEILSEIQTGVEKQLQAEFKHSLKRQALQDSIKGEINSILKERNDNTEDLVFQRFKAGAAEAFKILRRSV